MEESKKREEERKHSITKQLQKLMEEKETPLLLACLKNTPQSRSMHTFSASLSVAVAKLPKVDRVVAYIIFDREWLFCALRGRSGQLSSVTLQ